MQQKNYFKLMLPALVLCGGINLLLFILMNKLNDWHINSMVVAVGNAILFILVAISLGLHKKAASNKNPNVLFRSIMAAMLIKMMVLAIAAVVYLSIAKANRNVPGIVTVMGLYLVYLVIEVKAALHLNKKQTADASN